MTSQLTDEELPNYESFRDSLSIVLVQRLAQLPNTTRKTKPTRRSKQSQPAPSPAITTDDDASDLSDFIDYIATSAFTSLPLPLRTLTHHIWSTTPSLRTAYPLPLTAETTSPLLTTLDPSIPDSLLAYGVINTTDETAPLPSSGPVISLSDLLAPVLTSYLTAITTAPPAPASTKASASACEICQRDWINLTYHHLIPRYVHAKVVKRGWHRADELQNVAWLCGACHRFVHHFANHEDLARKYYTVELLLEQEEVRGFAEWVGRLRWKGLGVRRTKGA